MTLHKDLTGADLHEPKGVASAASGSVYVANGLGSGAWTAVKTAQVTITRTFDDISVAKDLYVGIPINGTISYIIAVIDGAITGTNASITFSLGGVAVDTSTITITASGSVAGTTSNSTPTGHNTVTKGGVLKITNAGGSTGAVKCSVTVVINAS